MTWWIWRPKRPEPVDDGAMNRAREAVAGWYRDEVRHAGYVKKAPFTVCGKVGRNTYFLEVVTCPECKRLVAAAEAERLVAPSRTG